MLAFFSNLRLSLKLSCAVILLVATIAAAIALSLQQLSAENTRLEGLVAHPVRQMTLAESAILSLVKVSRSARDLVVERSDAGKAAAIQAIAAEKASLRAALRELQDLSDSDRSATLREFSGAADAYLGLVDEMSALAQLNSKTRAFAVSAAEGRAAFDKLEGVVRAMVDAAASIGEKQRDVLALRTAASGQQMLTEINRFFRLEKEIVAEIDDGKLDALGKQADEAAAKVNALRDKMQVFANSRLAPDAMMEQMNLVADEFDQWIKIDQEIRRLAQENGDGRAQMLAATRGRTLLETAESAAKAWLVQTQAAMQGDLVAARRGYDESRTLLLTLAVSGSILSLLCVAWMIRGQITGPLDRLRRTMSRIAGGESVEVAGLARGDEIGDMARAVQVFKDGMLEAERLRDEQEGVKRDLEEKRRAALLDLAARFEATVGTVVSSVAASAETMKGAAGTMSETTAAVQGQAKAVTHAAEDASGNVQAVAAATEQLSQSVDEIGRQITAATQATGSAVEEARHSNAEMRGLAEAAQKIGEVVALINDIASQTNLLALNATIEAARAGDAGKGFAVVANEVKSLATQTGKATEEITGQIAAIQEAARRAVQSIEGIGTTIAGINDVATAIAAAIEEQSATTREIARNVEQAARGTQEVSDNIAGVSGAVERTGVSASAVSTATDDLAQQSTVLREQVHHFLGHVRAA